MQGAFQGLMNQFTGGGGGGSGFGQQVHHFGGERGAGLVNPKTGRSSPAPGSAGGDTDALIADLEMAMQTELERAGGRQTPAYNRLQSMRDGMMVTAGDMDAAHFKLEQEQGGPAIESLENRTAKARRRSQPYLGGVTPPASSGY